MIKLRLMGRRPLNRKRYTITLPEVMRDQLDAVGWRDDRTASDIVEDALRPVLKKLDGADALAKKQAADAEATSKAEPIKAKRKGGK